MTRESRWARLPLPAGPELVTPLSNSDTYTLPSAVMTTEPRATSPGFMFDADRIGPDLESTSSGLQVVHGVGVGLGVQLPKPCPPPLPLLHGVGDAVGVGVTVGLAAARSMVDASRTTPEAGAAGVARDTAGAGSRAMAAPSAATPATITDAKIRRVMRPTREGAPPRRAAP